ncbi:hypothetical protein HGRIS_014923 [Hohenbuehelia grisea]|uniref:Uncharacterized protein n=1 Tax=Hohenbuehelia grisea TaxID=104357 RepID=A0ABR3JCB2_9AGAR
MLRRCIMRRVDCSEEQTSIWTNVHVVALITRPTETDIPLTRSTSADVAESGLSHRLGIVNGSVNFSRLENLSKAPLFERWFARTSAWIPATPSVLMKATVHTVTFVQYRHRSACCVTYVTFECFSVVTSSSPFPTLVMQIIPFLHQQPFLCHLLGSCGIFGCIGWPQTRTHHSQGLKRTGWALFCFKLCSILLSCSHP